MKTAVARPDSAFTKFPNPLKPWHIQQQPSDPAQIRLQYPSARKVRMRRLVSRAACRPVFKHYALKAGRIVQCESQAELDLSLLLDVSPQVQAYGEQPFCIQYFDGSQIRRHIPDFAAQIDDERHVFEVKKEDWRDPGVLARTDLLKSSLAAYAVHYHLVVPGDIPEVHLRNANTLLQRSRQANTHLGSHLLWERVRIAGALCLAELGWDEPSIDGQSVAREIVEGRLQVDRSQLLNGASLVRPVCAQARGVA